MNKAKVYLIAGRTLLSIWVISWAASICRVLIPYSGFNNLMNWIFLISVLMLAFNPCAFIGAVILDLLMLKDHPERKRGWILLVILYLIIWAGLLIIYYMPQPPASRFYATHGINLGN